MTKRTIFSSFAPVEHYLQALESASGAPIRPLCVIDPLDIFILQQVAAFYETRPAVIDLAWAATAGTSLAIWNADTEDVEALVPAYLSSQEPFDEQAFAAHVQALGQPTPRLIRTDREMLDNPGVWEHLRPQLPVSSPLLVVLAHPEHDERSLSHHLQAVFETLPVTAVALFPVGRLGSSNVMSILNLVNSNPQHKVFLMREANAALFESKLCFVFHQSDRFLPAALERIAQLFEENFDFLGLAATNLMLQQALEQARGKNQRRAGRTAARGKESQQASRRSAFRRLRAIYHKLIPLPARLAFRRLRVGMIGVLRRFYRALIPLGIRLKLRDMRVSLLGRYTNRQD